MSDSSSTTIPAMTIGLDLGDRTSQICVLDALGNKIEEAKITTTADAFRKRFGSTTRARIALEAGTHSGWVSRLLTEWGHEVIVANPRKVRAISSNDRKCDRSDAETLARLARTDPKLLAPITHRGARAQSHLSALRSRDALVEARTKLINHVRGATKTIGHRLPSCSAESFPKKVADLLPESVRPSLSVVLETIATLTAKIRTFDRDIETACENSYPVTSVLRQVAGVGPVTALTFVLTVEDPERFKKSRSVGTYLGLVPRKDDSGERAPELPISKAGDAALRRLMVAAAHYILGPFGPDTDLRRWGLALAARGRKNAKKRAIVAVARKLAVLLHHLWRTGEVYQPLRAAKKKPRSNAPVAEPAEAMSATE